MIRHMCPRPVNTKLSAEHSQHSAVATDDLSALEKKLACNKEALSVIAKEIDLLKAELHHKMNALNKLSEESRIITNSMIRSHQNAELESQASSIRVKIAEVSKEIDAIKKPLNEKFDTHQTLCKEQIALEQQVEEISKLASDALEQRAGAR